MDITLRLRLELDQIKTEHISRDIEISRHDLLDRLMDVQVEAKRAGIQPFVVVALSRAAEILLATNQPTDALSAITDAKNVLGSSDPQGKGIDLLVREAQAYASLNKWEDASRVCGEGIGRIEHFRKKVTPLGLQSAYLRFKIELYQIGVRAAYELDKFELALERAELAKCATARRISRGSGPRNDEIYDLLAEYRKICESLDSDNLTSDARTQLTAKRRAFWDLISIRRFRENDKFEETLKVSEVQNTLNSEQAIIYYFWLSNRDLIIFGISRDLLIADLQEFNEHERALIDRIPDAILNYNKANGRILKPTREHTKLLFPQRIIEMIANKKRLIISPHRVLHLIPFQAFRLGDGHVIDHFSVSYIPNLYSTLVKYTSLKNQKLLALGVKKTLVQINLAEDIPPINNAEEEVGLISAIYAKAGIEGLTAVGPEATETMLRKLDESGELTTYTNLHFVCHGVTVDSDSPLESKLILYDSVLDGLDISGFRLNADLVMLSACCSGQRPFHTPSVGNSEKREELPGDELFGLQAAFSAAGVHQLVSTMWPVESDPALNISREFHKALLMGKAPDEALQYATKYYKENASLYFRSVDNWAPFFLVSFSIPNEINKED